MSRLATAIIFLFCGTMTVLLVRSVLYPEGTSLAAVDPHVPFDHFIARIEGTRLDVWEGGAIIGRCDFVPHSLATAGRVRVEVDWRIRLGQEFMGSSLPMLQGDVVLRDDCTVDEISLDLKLSGSDPPVRLGIRQLPGEPFPALKLERGTDILFESSAGLQPGGGNAELVSALLKNLGLPDRLLSTEKSEASTSRAGDVEAGGQTFDGYFLRSGDDPATSFTLRLSNTGEILRIDTPFTGENQLGLRLLSESLRPAGVPAPDFKPSPVKPTP